MSSNQYTPRDSSSRVSRRSFLQAAGAGTALAVGTPLLAAAQDATPVASPVVEGSLPTQWDQETDIVVVGSGAAAFSAAVTAAQAGAAVVMLEKAANPGGTTLISGNGYWIPNNRYMQELELTDPREDALKLMARLSYPQLYDPESPDLGLPPETANLQSIYYDSASAMVNTFDEWGALYSAIQPGFGYSGQPVEIGDPEYHAELPENKAPFGRLLWARTDRSEFATIPQQMQVWTDANGVPLQTESRVVGVFRNSAGEVVGVQVDTPGGTQAIRARKAIVFGSGGFTQDPFKSLNYLRGPIFAGCGVPSNTGDFVDIGISLGAKLGNMNQAWWLQCPLEMALQSPALPGADVWMPYGDSMVIVNKYGNRVVSEKKSYNERGQIHHFYDGSHSEYPNLVLFMIYDDAVAQDPTEFGFRFPIPAPGETADYVITGATWDELIANITTRLDSIRGGSSVSARVGPDVRLADNFSDRLATTIQRFNGFAESGVDEDFARGSTPIQVAWGSGTARFGELANPTMAPFRSEGPYYCILIGGMTLDTKGGPVTDASSRVVRTDGSVIPGLYGAGNCIASLSGQAYWSAGGTLGPALTFGHIAGANAAAESEKALI